MWSSDRRMRSAHRAVRRIHHLLAINFVDFKKAFDSIHHQSLWQILHLYGVLEAFDTIFKDGTYDRAAASRLGMATQTATGVRQGCILSPLLFLVALDYIIQRAGACIGASIYWSELDRLSDLDFADDITLFEEDEPKMHHATTALEEVGKVGLKISGNNSNIMYVSNTAQTRGVTVGTQQLEKFTYFGGVISQNGYFSEDEQDLVLAIHLIEDQAQPILHNRNLLQ